ncbi:hook-length control protein FliK [Nitrosospira sp. Nl5]|uniref:flagellar hook-length control protein FliK n=1 Tax=Nitrosospira sp. Nl5 TaxID=200120 RepID=UPI000882C09F|nr:flagellar hook-length control protein FliK [Nitrosospira sp. Nl5]SCY07778.1 hook-length control protein FliK [Nitrosospira sp. Nl5]
MQNIPLLQNPSNNFSPSPIKHTISSGDADGDVQRGNASFDKVLADEMNGRYEAAEATPANTGATSNTAPSKLPENTGATVEDLKDLKDSGGLKDSIDLKDMDLAGLEELENLVDVKGTETQEKAETKSDIATITIIATTPQLTELTGMLPGLSVAHHPSIRIAAGNPTETSAEERIGVPPEPGAEARIDVGRNIPAAAGVDVSRNALADAGVDARADVPQAESATAAGQQAAIAVIQSGLVSALAGKAGTGAQGAITPALAGDLKSRTAATLAAAAVAPMRGKHAAVTKDIQDETATKLTLSATQSAARQVEFSSPDFSVPGQGEKCEKSLLELATPKEVHIPGLVNVSAALAVFAPEQGAVPAAAGAPVHTALWLEPRIGAAGWDNALGQKILWMVSNQQQVAELNLDPPDLGPLQVILSITDDQASATFVSQHADVRQALEAALPRLKEMMAESGISLGNTTVSADTPQQQGGFERQHHADTPRRSGGDAIGASEIKSTKSTTIGMGYIDTGRSRLVDTFA